MNPIFCEIKLVKSHTKDKRDGEKTGRKKEKKTERNPSIRGRSNLRCITK